MEGTLPETIRWRKDKARLGSNLRRGLLEGEQPRLDRLILDSAASIPRFGEFIDLALLPDWYHGLRAQPTSTGALDLYRVATLAIWLAREGAGDSRPAL